MTGNIPSIFAYIFEPTLAIITTNFVDYPEHRIHFFSLIRAVNDFCFNGLRFFFVL